jgi:hypothetical protein
VNAMLRSVSLDLCVVVVLALFTAGCASDMVKLVPITSASAQKVAVVEGSSSGALGVFGTAYYFIPMGLNSRMQRAYDEALSKAPGATGLKNVTLQENWYWFFIGTMRCVTITGEAVK